MPWPRNIGCGLYWQPVQLLFEVQKREQKYATILAFFTKSDASYRAICVRHPPGRCLLGGETRRKLFLALRKAARVTARHSECDNHGRMGGRGDKLAGKICRRCVLSVGAPNASHGCGLYLQPVQ